MVIIYKHTKKRSKTMGFPMNAIYKKWMFRIYVSVEGMFHTEIQH